LRRTTWQSGWRYLRDLIEDTTFMTKFEKDAKNLPH
jgi:hypothetical protein